MIRLKLLYQVIVPMLLFCLVSELQSQIIWQKDRRNPVITGGSGGFDDRHAWMPTVIHEDSIYKMWYVGFNSQYSIGYAISNDGINWSRYEGNPVLTPGSIGEFDDGFIWGGTVLKDSNGYRLYYGGFNRASAGAIGLATSPDGIHWTKFLGNPILTRGVSGAWDGDAVHSPCVVKDSAGHYLMWFTGTKQPTSAIGYATSSDGVVWTKYYQNPIVRPDSSNYWESFIVTDARVMKIGNIYHMFFFGAPGPYNYQIGYARSSDGLSWSRYSGNPVLRLGTGNEWDSYTLGMGLVNYENNKFKMWYSGRPVYDYWQIGYATSEFTPDTSILQTVANWHLDETSGSFVADSSLYHNDGTAFGTTIVTGVSGNARHFNGSGDYIYVPSSASFNFNPDQSFTIEAWFRSTASGVQEIVRRGLAPVPGYLLRLNEGHVMGTIGNREDGSPPDTLLRITSVNLYNDGNWHHASLVRDRVARKLYLYVDEQLSTNPLDDNIPFALTNDRPLMIGRWENPTYPTYFSGDIDEVRITRAALHPQASEFLMNISVKDAGTGVGNLTFGTRAGASDGIDSIDNEFELPPIPPAGDFDARWLISNTNGTLRDIRDTVGEGAPKRIYIGTIQPGPDGFPMTLQWAPSVLPYGSFILQDRLTHGTMYRVNMKTQSSLVVADSTPLPFEIIYTDTLTIVASVERGWNLISLPVTVEDPRVNTLFPTATSAAYMFNGGYVPVESLAYGEGYWLNFGANQLAGISGAMRNRDTVRISRGWNIGVTPLNRTGS